MICVFRYYSFTPAVLDFHNSFKDYVMMLGIELAEITIRSLNRDFRYSNSASMYSIAYKLCSLKVLER